MTNQSAAERVRAAMSGWANYDACWDCEEHDPSNKTDCRFRSLLNALEIALEALEQGAQAGHDTGRDDVERAFQIYMARIADVLEGKDAK